jgi:hypothetical protein
MHFRAGAVTSGVCSHCEAGAYQTGSGQPLLSDAAIMARIGVLVRVLAARRMNAIDLDDSSSTTFLPCRGPALRSLHHSWNILDRIRPNTLCGPACSDLQSALDMYACAFAVSCIRFADSQFADPLHPSVLAVRKAQMFSRFYIKVTSGAVVKVLAEID